METPKIPLMNKQRIFAIGSGLVILVALFAVNPFSWNDATERTVVTTASGNQFVEFNPGLFYSGFFSKETTWPNQISVSYQQEEADWDLEENTIEIGLVEIPFNDPAKATAKGITQYILPADEKKMLEIHNAHRSVEGLVKRRLAPYTQECLSSCAQLMNTEMHYSGGRAQMSQDYLDQLRNGVYLLNVMEVNTYDTIERANRKIYQVQKQLDASGNVKRKYSSIKEYGINVADAQITNVDYESAIDSLISKKLTAATKASVSKQELMTAQQQALTAEAQGKKTLVEIEYKQKQEQTIQVVQAQTLVEVAKQDLLKQEIARQAAEKEAAKIKTLADAEAYAKQRVMQADGALEKKLATYEKVQANWAKAFSEFQGAIVPQYQSGAGTGGGMNAMQQFMEFQNMKAAKDLNLDLTNKR